MLRARPGRGRSVAGNFGIKLLSLGLEDLGFRVEFRA